MINVHKRLIEAFDTLPDIGATAEPVFAGFKPRYEWGDDVHWNKLIKLFGNDPGKSVYPIIYNSSNTIEHDTKRVAATATLTLILATRNTSVDMTNSQRWATSYNNVLFPLARNIEQLFTKSQIFAWDGIFTTVEFPNYGQNGENKTTDIIDALRFDTTITINDKCLKTIKYT